MFITQIVRTIVPLFWASIVGIVLGWIPALEPLRDLLLSQSEFVVTLITGLLIAAWMTFSAWAQKYLPDWAARVFMGSTKTPTYETIPGEYVTIEPAPYPGYPVAKPHEPSVSPTREE